MSAASQAPPRAAAILATLILGAAVANMNLSVANVALPTIGRDLDASQVSLNLVAVGFTLGLAASVLYLGAVADRYGRRLMLLGGLALSIPMALLSAYAPDVEVLALARVGGGIAAGMAFPTTLSIVVALFRGQPQTRAIALWTGIGCGASALGPAVAGYLLENHGWGSAFILTVPIAAVALVLALFLIPRELGEDDTPVDHLGGVLSVLAIGLLTLGLHFVSMPAEARIGGIWLVGSVVAFALFAWRQRRAEHPLFDLAIASRRIFWVAALTGLIVFGTLVGSMFVGQQYVQNVLGYSTFEAGCAALPMSVAMVLASPVAARMIERRGTRQTMAAGIIFVLAGIALMFTWREGASYLPVGAAYAVIGIGIGLAGTPASRSIMAAVPRHRAGMGSGTTDLQRDLGAAVMQSVLAIFLTREYTASVNQQLADLPAAQRSSISEQTAGILRDSFGGAQQLAERYPQQGEAIIKGARTAFIDGSAAAIAVALIAVALGLLVTWFGFPHRDEELALETEYAREQ
ncbi:MAG: MFS transporter [Gaiellales bacterium]